MSSEVPTTMLGSLAEASDIAERVQDIESSGESTAR